MNRPRGAADPTTPPPVVGSAGVPGKAKPKFPTGFDIRFDGGNSLGWNALILDYAEAMDARLAARGCRPALPSRRRGLAATAQIAGVLIAGLLLSAGLVDHVPGLILSSIVAIVLLVAGVTYHAGRSRAYAETLAAGANDSLREIAKALEAERQRRIEAEAECDLSLDLTPPPFGERYVYVLGFSTGAVKVGQTFDPPRRIREHRRDAAAFGVNLVSFWVSPAHKTYLANEVTLIDVCRAAGVQIRREYFHGVSFDDVVAAAARLPYPSRQDNGKATFGGRSA